MANKSKVLESGAQLDMTTGSWPEAHSLFKIVMRELGSVDSNSEMDKKMMVRLLSSDTVEVALWACLARCSYNKIKVTPKLFDQIEDARSDYLEIAGEVLGFNLDPFFKSLSSKSTPQLEEVFVTPR